MYLLPESIKLNLDKRKRSSILTANHCRGQQGTKNNMEKGKQTVFGRTNERNEIQSLKIKLSS